MYYNSIFQQLFNFIPRYRFEKSVKNLSGDHYCKTFSAWQQFLTCLYAQITGKDSPMKETPHAPRIHMEKEEVSHI